MKKHYRYHYLYANLFLGEVFKCFSIMLYHLHAISYDSALILDLVFSIYLIIIQKQSGSTVDSHITKLITSHGLNPKDLES